MLEHPDRVLSRIVTGIDSPLSVSPGFRAWIAPGAALLVLVALLGAVVVAARITGDPALPPAAPALIVPSPARPTVAYDVERAQGDQLVVAAGQDVERQRFEITVPPGTAIDVLEAIEPGAIAPGDWVTVVGVKNEVRNFAVKMVVVLPGGGTPDGEGWARTAAGFIGDEVARETREVAILGGIVTAVRPGAVVIDSGGPVTVTLAPDAFLRRIRPGVPADLRDGDRFALHDDGSGKPNLAQGMLVLVGGAK